MDIPYYISENIDTTFDTAHSIMADINDLDGQIADLQGRRHNKCATLASITATLLCLVSIDSGMFHGRKHKMPLIKLYRKAYGGDLIEAKNIVEEYIEPGELV